MIYLDKISKEIKRLGISKDNIEIKYNWINNFPYISGYKNVHPKKISLLNKKILEIVLMHKIDEAVKKKFGEKPSDRAWVKYGNVFGFKKYYLKSKIKGKVEKLQYYLDEIKLQIDFVEKKKTAEEMRLEIEEYGRII